MARNNSINKSTPSLGINTPSTPNGNLFNIDGSVGTKFTNISSTTTLDNSHHTIFTSGTLTLNLPQASTATGREYVIVKTDDTNTLTIDPYSTETINGNLTFVLSLSSSCTIKSNGNNWHLINFSNFKNQTYNITNYSTDRTMDVMATNIDEIANILATLISDLKNNKII